MKRHTLSCLSFLIAALLAAGSAAAAEKAQDWELVNPAGATRIETILLAPRIATLAGKIVGLEWNEKPNGNLFLDRVAELLIEKVPGVKIVKFYDAEPSTVPQSANMEAAAQKARTIRQAEPMVVFRGVQPLSPCNGQDRSLEIGGMFQL